MDSRNITISPVDSSELLHVKDLLKEVWLDTYKSYTPEQSDKITENWHAVEKLAKEVEDNNIFFSAARDDGKIVGVITAKRDGNLTKIPRLYIKKTHQGKGIGTLLVNEAVFAFPQAKKLEVGVEEENERARRFYKRHGFVDVGTYEENVEGQHVKLIVMQKDL